MASYNYNSNYLSKSTYPTRTTTNRDDYNFQTDRNRQTTTAYDSTDRYGGSRDPLQPSRVENLASRDYSQTTVPMDVDNPRATREQSELDQLLALVKQMNKIDLDKVESALKVVLSRPTKIDQEKQKEEYLALKESYDNLLIKYEDAMTKHADLLSESKQIIKETKTKMQEVTEAKINQYKSLIKAKEDEIKCLKSEKDSALSRLSKEMGDKLNENNTGIADLSDPNRSTKLAEKYNSLYDNEWTDALETVSKKVDEDAGVRYLLEIKKHIYSFCNGAKAELLKDLTGRFANPILGGRNQSDASENQEDQEIRKMLETCLKIKVQTAIPNLQKSYQQMSSSNKPTYADRLPEFVNKCIEICWLMNTQSPTLVFGEPLQSGQSIDRDQYKEYTKQGDVVSYVVWLPLLIEKDGAVLSKGVVQPVPLQTRRTTKYEQNLTYDTEKSKARSIRETQEEQRNRMLKIPPVEPRDIEVQKKLDEHDQRFSEPINENGQQSKGPTGHFGRQTTSVEPQVDAFFQDSRSRGYSANISSKTVSAVDSYLTPTTTYSGSTHHSTMSFKPRTKTNNNERDPSSEMNERPHSAYTLKNRETSEYVNRPLTSGTVMETVNKPTITYMDPSRQAEVFVAGNTKYALFNKSLYSQDKYTGQWRIASGISGESNA